MTREKAKSLLSIYRPGLEDELPEVKDALCLLETDTHLRAWYDNEKQFDRSLQEARQHIAPPADLKARILAAAKAQQDPVVPFEPEKTATPHTTAPWWKQNITYSIAACILLIAILGVLLTPQANQNDQNSGVMIAGIPVAEFVSSLTHATHEHGRFDYQSRDITLIKDYLLNNNAPTPRSIDDIPVGLSKLAGMGCMTFQYDGHDITMICFKGDKVYHLFVGNRNNLSCDAPTTPVIDRFGRHSAATWVRDEHFFLLTTEGSVDEISDLL